MKVYLLAIILFLIFFSPCQAQENDIRLANEYYLSAQYEKAYIKFKELDKSSNIPFIYKNYLRTLKTLDKTEEAEKFLKKALKAYPDNLFFRLDYFILLKELKDKKAEKYFSEISHDICNTTSDLENASEFLVQNGMAEKAKELLLDGRKASGNKSEYAIQLSKVYQILGNKSLMIDEIINYVNMNPYQLESVKNNLQNNLKEKEDMDMLESKLFNLVQKDPENLVYNELLLWINIQNKNFRSAYYQAKAIDRKNKMQGAKLIEVGRIALENKDYDAAEKYFKAVSEEYKNSFNYSLARRLLIYSKEEAVKSTYPVDSTKILSLIGDYKTLIIDLGRSPQSLEAKRSMAVLYAFYLDRNQEAIEILKDIILSNIPDEKLKAEAKINLADIYLLNEEPWEASLLYSQVEKDMKEDVLGHEAKLKNAKLAYYTGEFELAQAHLDILKMATTREIANDAMDLSILIQDNSGLDTSYDALREYASVDLLLFQHKDQEALNRLDSLLAHFPGHPLTDEIYFQKARILRKEGKYDRSIEMLDKILTDFPTGIYGDDALFNKGVIFEENFGNKEEAMEAYKELLFKYPGSIFTAEARKRIRILRGDKL